MIPMAKFSRWRSGADDPYAESVVLLLHGDGTEGSTTIVDEIGHAMTAYGYAELSATNQKFGSACMVFSAATPGSRISTPDHADFDLGSGDWTIEMWVMQDYVAPSASQMLIAKRGASSDRGPFALMIPSNTKKVNLLLSKTGATYDINIVSSVSMTLDVYSHVAACRSGTDVTLWLDGASAGSGTLSGALLVNSNNVIIGSDETGTSTRFGGRIDDVRITKGVARYTAAFTPPTKAFPDP